MRHFDLNSSILSSSLEAVSPHLLHFTEATKRDKTFSSECSTFVISLFSPPMTRIILLLIYINPFNFELLVYPTNQSNTTHQYLASNAIRERKKLREEYDIKHVLRSLRALVMYTFSSFIRKVLKDIAGAATGAKSS